VAWNRIGTEIRSWNWNWRKIYCDLHDYLC